MSNDSSAPVARRSESAGLLLGAGADVARRRRCHSPRSRRALSLRAVACDRHGTGAERCGREHHAGRDDGAPLAIVRDGMRQVVTSGTACCLMEQQIPVHVAGKTGTAETDVEAKKKPHAWFEAFAPYEEPKIAIVALVTNSGEGAQYAAPAVRETLAWYFSQPRP